MEERKYLDLEGLRIFKGKLDKVITDNEKVVAASLNEMRAKLDGYISEDDLEGVVSSIDTDEIAESIEESVIEHYAEAIENIPKGVVKITHNELKTLRDAENLSAGTWYRITDYECTTTQESTRSAGNRFDIMVLALDEKTLCEEAKAIQHEGDTYFDGCKLEAWKIWYCLDNDATRFLWADEDNGKGVIYRMIDEWNNDVPYDFKNIQFVKLLSDDKKDIGENPCWLYTFCYLDEINGNEIRDAANLNFITDVWECTYEYHDNKIGACYEMALNEENGKYIDTHRRLNNIVIFVYRDDDNYTSIYGNTFGTNCRDNFFVGSDMIYGNIIENSFCNNAIDEEFLQNIIGSDVRNCIFHRFIHNKVLGDAYDCEFHGTDSHYGAVLYQSKLYVQNCLVGGYIKDCEFNCAYSSVGSENDRCKLSCRDSTIGSGLYKVVVEPYMWGLMIDDHVFNVTMVSSKTVGWQEYHNIHIQKVSQLSTIDLADVTCGDYTITFGSSNDVKINV